MKIRYDESEERTYTNGDIILIPEDGRESYALGKLVGQLLASKKYYEEPFDSTHVKIPAVSTGGVVS